MLNSLLTILTLNPANIAYKLINTLLFLVILFILFLFISTICTILTSSILQTPFIQESNVSFHIDEYNDLYSEVLANCDSNNNSEYIKDCFTNSLEYINYQVILEIEAYTSKISNNNNSNNSNNNNNNLGIEFSFKSNLNSNKNFSIRKVTYFRSSIKTNNSIISLFIDLIYNTILFIPRNIFGFFTTEKITVNIVDDLDNNDFFLDYVSIRLFNSNNTLIKNTKVLFIPKLSFKQFIIKKIRFLTEYSIFFGSLVFQILVYIIYQIINTYYRIKKKIL